MNLIGQSLRKFSNSKHLNILCIPTHETANSDLANSFPQHQFYFLYGPNLKTWDSRFRREPINCHMLKDGCVPLDLNFDIILSQNFANQYSILKPISQQYNIPIICITHTYPYPGMKSKDLEKIKLMCGDVNIFITKASMNKWGWKDNEGVVIEHMMDTEVFRPSEKERQPYILSVCNQFNKPIRWEPCGFPLWRKVIYGLDNNNILPWFHLGADCDSFAQPAKNLEDLIQHYQNARIFINTSLLSPIPMSLLEAASCGCCCVSTATCEIPNIFTNGHDSILSNDPVELRMTCQRLLQDPKECKRLGDNARLTIQKRFGKEKFKKAWQQAFQMAIDSKNP